MSEYRFSTVTTPANGETTIYRGRLYRLGDLGYTDMWANYWDGDGFVAFYDEGFRGMRPMHDGDDDQTRAMNALSMMRENMTDDGALDRVAKRLGGERFITVTLDVSTYLYVMTYNTGEGAFSADRAWRDEIEAVWNGDVYRVETEEFDGSEWQPADDLCEEWYGEHSAEAGFEKEFPLAEFPAEMLVGSDG